jgi:hypothetical protein
MKVLFLDNDGVICLENNWGSRRKKQKKWGRMKMSMREVPVEYRFDDFDRKAVDVLNSVLDETGAEIVVSSDWRLHATLDELGDYYELQGIRRRPIAVTDLFKDIYPHEWSTLRFRADVELERYMEIQHWVDHHPDMTHWVAVDDLNMSIEFLGDRFSAKNGSDEKPGLKNFVLTPKSSEGIKQLGVKEKMISYLNSAV